MCFHPFLKKCVCVPCAFRFVSLSTLCSAAESDAWFCASSSGSVSKSVSNETDVTEQTERGGEKNKTKERTSLLVIQKAVS